MNAENADKTINNQRVSAFIGGKNYLIYLRNLVLHLAVARGDASLANSPASQIAGVFSVKNNLQVERDSRRYQSKFQLNEIRNNSE